MAKTVVEINNLVKRYKEIIALDNFSLKINEGEIFGLLGPNGSGKTTTINCLLSLLSYDKGEIKLFDEKMEPSRRDLKSRIGIVPQNVAVFDELTVYENVEYFCGLYIKDKHLKKKCVDEAIDFVDIADFKKFYPKKLSGGLLRRLNIACGIAHKPKFIIFDACVIIGLNQRKPYKSRVAGLSPIILDRKIGTLTLLDDYLCSAA